MWARAVTGALRDALPPAENIGCDDFADWPPVSLTAAGSAGLDDVRNAAVGDGVLWQAFA